MAPLPPHPPAPAGRGPWSVQVAGRIFRIDLDEHRLRVDGEPLDIELSPASEAGIRVARIGHRRLRVVAQREGEGRWRIRIGRAHHEVRVRDAGRGSAEGARPGGVGEDGHRVLRAPMPGLVVRIGVSPGDVVEPGSGLVTLDAMKMENELVAKSRVRVAGVLVAAGDPVEKGQLLVTFEDPEGGG